MQAPVLIVSCINDSMIDGSCRCYVANNTIGLCLLLPCSLQENSTTCPATTSAPPSGLSTGGVIAIGIIFGLLGLVAVAIVVVVVVVLVVMFKRRGWKKS